jgi:hypothetical protein
VRLQKSYGLGAQTGLTAATMQPSGRAEVKADMVNADFDKFATRSKDRSFKRGKVIPSLFCTPFGNFSSCNEKLRHAASGVY